MAFDIDKLFDDCNTKISVFAREHADETFYAFAIDADFLCLNSNEQFARTLDEYQSGWKRRNRHIDSFADLTEEDMRHEEIWLQIQEETGGLDRSDETAVLQEINEGRSLQRALGRGYESEDEVKDLRDNPGDWAYQGFAELDAGFDGELYDDHYYAAMESDDGHAPHTDYAIAMTELVRRLHESHAFDGLRRTEDFVVNWVDHSY